MTRTWKRIVLVLLVIGVAAACARVLGFQKAGSWAFPHRKHVVAGISCLRCHDGIEAGSPGAHIPGDASCLSCHDKPHNPASCVTCHLTPGKVEAVLEAKDHLKFDHVRHLRGEAQGNCMRCHSGVAEGDTHMRPPMATCFKCHGEAQTARTCSTCHKNLETEGTLPQSHLAHDGDWIREHGAKASASGDLCETCHTQSYCASCHGATVPALTANRRFTDPFQASAHRAGFAARHSLEAAADPGACTTCHQPDRCIACHTSRELAGQGRKSPHPAGWVGLSSAENLHGREARRDPTACAGCHGGAGEQLCVTCHSVGGPGGNPHPPGWTSDRTLSEMPCRMCHPIGAR